MKICYINFNLNSPRDQITLYGLKENGITIKEIADHTPGWRKYLNIAREYRASKKDYDLLHQGVDMISKQLHALLSAKGLTQIKAIGEEFDPHQHEPLEVVEDPDVEKDIVVAV